MAEVLLALDVGEARIGLAKAEPGLSFVFGRGYLDRQDSKTDLERIRTIADREGATLIVVGLPKRTDGADSPQTQRVRSFAAGLEALGLRVAFEDERFTSQLAGRRLAGSGLRKRQRQEKGRLDEAAAVLILESYLAKQRARDASETA